MKLKKALCVLIAALTVLCALPLPGALPIAAAPSSAATATVEKSVTADAVLSAPDCGTAFKPKLSDVLASQFVLTDDARSISLAVTGKGQLSLALFAFRGDYELSLIGTAVAEADFEISGGTAYPTFTFPSDAPLAAGEYILAAYRVDGTSLLSGAGHEAQRAHVNSAFRENVTFAVTADYVGTPAKPYGIPTAPHEDEEYDPAPHMGTAMDFRLPESKDWLVSANAMTTRFIEENGESFTRLQPSTDAGDPFIYMEKGGVPAKTTEYKYLLLRVRLDEDAPTAYQIFFITDEQSISEGASFKANYKATTEWQDVIIDLGSNGNYKGQLKYFRFDVFQSVKGSHYVDIEYAAVFKTREAAEAFDGNFDRYREEEPIKPDDDGPDYSTYRTADEPAPAEAGKLTPNGRLPYIYKEYPHTLDMSGSIDAYTAEGSFGFYSLPNIIMADGRLYVRSFGSCALFTKGVVGDDYGVRGGDLTMDMQLTYGKMAVTLRQAQANDSKAYSGLVFTISTDGHVDLSDRDGFSSSAETGVDFTQPHAVTFRDAVDALILLVDGNEVLRVGYDYGTQTLSHDLDSNVSRHLPGAGYATIAFDTARGWVDNVTYTHVDVVPTETAATLPVDYSTWVAVDDLGRRTPTAAEVGEAQEKYVGVFYFMCHNFLAGRYTQDVTQWYLEGGSEKVSRELSAIAGRAGAYWAEPYFGYYSSYDEWVFRKHAYQLDAAGVDFVFLDLSNDVFYQDCLTVLFDTWLDIRRNGGHTPQICFMFGDMPFTLVDGLYQLRPFLENPDYQELFFKWDGKPLVFGNYDGKYIAAGERVRYWTVSGTTPQTQATFKAMINDRPALKEWFESEYVNALETVTVKKCWAWQAHDHKAFYDYWDWLQDYPQQPGRDPNGEPFQMAVSMGTHAHTNRGRSLLDNDTSYNKDGEFGFTLDTTKEGLAFAQQFEYALSQEGIKMIMITGWNEWYAGVQSTSNQQQISAGTLTPGYYMVDQMSPEYSRDGEPMRIRDGVGFGDNYYYQMVSYIRRFKGATAPATVNGGGIDMTASDVDAAWKEIGPAFTDAVGDAALRSELGWAAEYLYTNGTARNDLDYAKVTQDDDYVYFYVTTARPIITADDGTWMNLYVNTDGDAATGWEGYDVLINRSRTDKTVSVEAFCRNEWAFTALGEADYVLGESSMTVRVPKTLLGGKSGDVLSFTFKWADHADVQGDVMRFMELGDSAPSDRFAFLYNGTSVTDERVKETEPEETTPVEPETDPETAPETDPPATEAETADVTADVTTETDSGEIEAKHGCKSIVSASALLMLAAAAAVAMKKTEIERKHDHE